jgi:hypothetical protein
MRQSVLPALALLCLPTLPAAAWAAEGKPAAPTVVVRIAPLDELLADFRYLGSLTDREELVKQLEGFVKTNAGPAGLRGIDTKKPLGFYGTVNASGFDSTGVLLVPVSDEKAFLDQLAGRKLKAEKGADGVYTVQVENALSPPIYFRFANGYAYITVLNQAAISGNALLPPAEVLAPGAGGVLSAVVRIDRIPDNIKQLALENLALRLADLRDRRFPGTTPAEKEFSKQAFEALGNDVRALLRDGREVRLRLDVDRQAQDLDVEITADAKPDSRLATGIADLARKPSLFAGLLSKDAGLQALIRATLPEELRRAVRPFVDNVIARALEKETEPARRQSAERFLNAIKPTLESGEVDAAVVLHAPAGGTAQSLVVGARVKDGTAIDRAFREFVQSLPAGDRAQIKLDAEQVGGVRVHRLDVQRDFDARGRQAFGDNSLYLAFRADAVFLVLGPNGPAVLKEALTATPGATAPLQFDAAMAKLAPAIAIDRQDKKGAVAGAAREAFGQEGSDRIQLVLEGGKALKLRFSMKGGVLKFVSLLDRSERAGK